MPKILGVAVVVSAEYARQQVSDAARVLETQHNPTPHGCGCTRPLPCSVAARWQRHGDRFEQQLALAETQALPAVAGRHRAAW